MLCSLDLHVWLPTWIKYFRICCLIRNQLIGLRAGWFYSTVNIFSNMKTIGYGFFFEYILVFVLRSQHIKPQTWTKWFNMVVISCIHWWIIQRQSNVSSDLGLVFWSSNISINFNRVWIDSVHRWWLLESLHICWEIARIYRLVYLLQLDVALPTFAHHLLIKVRDQLGRGCLWLFTCLLIQILFNLLLYGETLLKLLFLGLVVLSDDVIPVWGAGILN